MEWADPKPAMIPMKEAYHHGRTVKRVRTIDQSTREFVAWDGEGVNIAGPGKPQSYVLFGCNLGYVHSLTGLSTFDCLDFILSVGERYPTAIHIGFAFSYDSNMIIQSLSPATLSRLHTNGFVRITRKNGTKYTITFARGKYFRVTRYRPEYDAKHNSTAKTTVQIFDIFSFFAKSFIKAYEQTVGPVPDIIRSGKAGRASFSIEEFDTILEYWTVEIEMLRKLAEELRVRVMSAGLHITQWYGPGALASYAMREHNIRSHMSLSNDEVRLAARYGYAGGRFEPFLIGRIMGPIYGIDINSAYPYGITKLPSLAEGSWVRVDKPKKLTRFGIYNVVLKKGGGFVRSPSPLFHRDSQHNISFPWSTQGWYWSPEAHEALLAGATITEGWEYRGAKTLPFGWVYEMYKLRKLWQKLGISAELALKLCLNSMYGKLAQRIGWTIENQRIPPFHQLEWAGWVTSYIRAMIYGILKRIPPNQLVAVETDGIYTTMNPEELGITASKELGEWSVDVYTEAMYVQSGLAWLKKPDGTWVEKRRGLDGCRAGHKPEECDCEGVFSVTACQEYLKTLTPNPTPKNPWKSFVGNTSRFIGLGQALAANRRFSERHCVWQTTPREISPGTSGKRVHIYTQCRACKDGKNAYEAAHDLVIMSLATMNPASFPHSVPWEEEIGHAKWRDYEENIEDLVTY